LTKGQTFYHGALLTKGQTFYYGGQILVIGSLAGMTGGLLLALVIDRLAGIVYRRMVAHRH